MNIWLAIADLDLPAVENFLANGVSPNAKDENGYTPIHAAASYSSIPILTLLLSHNGNINITDNDGDTPLHFVEDAETAKFLIENGADWKIQNSEGQLAIEVADEDERDEVVDYLKQYVPEFVSLRQLREQGIEITLKEVEDDEQGESSGLQNDADR
ncbi:hypothetical protein HK098_002261 [Nowakowskiella sp. JEL0407]|nr:hypothetical protein HK098_002261 [Nowakowskiella sp. JEL0407]